MAIIQENFLFNKKKNKFQFCISLLLILKENQLK